MPFGGKLVFHFEGARPADRGGWVENNVCSVAHQQSASVGPLVLYSDEAKCILKGGAAETQTKERERIEEGEIMKSSAPRNFPQNKRTTVFDFWGALQKL
eukprot:TRINITY_DN13764_c0_g1_i1.p2 TRINITY_DN13764_c0_g1~~TRINITY_DN13764_c0_g1_i1.p2  ORF type:complete len:100 (+),score=2.19 TRINITY_DN13764_c0_g1_i1:113-412(+)